MALTEVRFRPAFPHEFVPEDYFRRLSLKEFQEIFGNENEIEVDLGSGDGSYVVALAEHYPDRNFLAVERLLGRVQKTSRKAEQKGLKNLKVLRLESSYVVEWLLPAASVSRLHLVCPDPWPKAKHHRRRLVQEPFLQTLDKLLVPDGRFLFKTDHEEYFEWSEEVVEASPLFEAVARPEEFDPKSDFQRQWEAEGKSLQTLFCRRV